jgi:hypothetical protein
MRADSLGGRIVGALARDPGVESSAFGASELPGWIEHENMALPGRPLRLRRSSMLGRIVAALARTESVAATAPALAGTVATTASAPARTGTVAAPFTPAPQEVPSGSAELTVLLAGQRPSERTALPTRLSGPMYSYEPVEPTAAARLRIITVPG